MFKKLLAFLSVAVIAVVSLSAAALVGNTPNGIAVAAGENLVANPSVEQATNATTPTGWSSDKWGTNTTAFSYETTGHTGSRSIKVKTTSYRSGDAKWYFTPVTVTPTTEYTFSNWYKSTTATDIDIVVTDTAGKVTYLWQGSVPASASWKQNTYKFKTPLKAKNVTVYHYLHAVGEVTTDDYGLTQTVVVPPTTTPPTVNITSPINNSTVGGVQTVTANATDAQSITKVQFRVNGINVGAADTTYPYSFSWDTKTVANGSHQLTAIATNNSNLSTTSSPVAVTVNNAPTPPQVSVTIPAPNATVVGTQTVAATASDFGSITKVQFRLDGTNIGTADTTYPYNIDWDSVGTTNGTHQLSAVATNNSNLSTTSANVPVLVDNPMAPIVSIATPATSATVSAVQTITANAGGNRPITSVQFRLDNANFGLPDTSAPYSIDWDTQTATNGSHTITAIATNNAGLTTTASIVTVTVNNTTPPTAVNLLQNPSVELSTAGAPTNWGNGNWGTNTATFSYDSTAGHTGTHSLVTNVTSYTDGAANWYHTPISVVQGTTYQYSNWYQSTMDTEIDIEVTMADNSTQYFYLTVAPASPTAWVEVTGTFTAPTDAVSATFYQTVTAVGTVKQDDFSVTEYHATPFTRGLVSLTFDDGWRSIYTEGLPILTAHNMKSTQYLLTNTIDFPDYMTVAMMQDFKNAGHEIASHTVSHAHLPLLTPAQLNDELVNSQNQLRTWFGASPVADNFATPYGEYNTAILDAIKPLYRSHRSTDVGFNTKDTFNIYNIKVQNVFATTTPEQVQAWVSQALADKSWLVLVYHEITASPSSDDPQYVTTPTNLSAQLDKIQASGITVKTVGEALDEISPQL